MGTKIAKTVVLLTSLFSLLFFSSCNSTTVEQVTEEQKKSDAFIEALSKKGDYKELRFLNEDEAIYYKELKDAPEANKGVHPFQNSTVAVTLEGELAMTGQEFQPQTTISNLVISGTVSSPTTQGYVPGVQIALQSMEVGDTWEVVIPWRLGYGSSSMGGIIPAYAPLKFVLTLDKIVKP